MFAGGSAGQSSIFQCLDILLGIKHSSGKGRWKRQHVFSFLLTGLDLHAGYGSSPAASLSNVICCLQDSCSLSQMSQGSNSGSSFSECWPTASARGVCWKMRHACEQKLGGRGLSDSKGLIPPRCATSRSLAAQREACTLWLCLLNAF